MTDGRDELIEQALQLDPNQPETFLTAGREARAWLVLAVGSDRQHGGNDGYDDLPDSHYSWDSTVPNSGLISPGDALVLWDKHQLLGASVVEEIDTAPISKVTYSCPACGLASLKQRKTRSPLYKCFKCGHTFDVPLTTAARKTSYRSRHDAGWVDLWGVLDGPTLRALCVSPKSQLSLRPLRWQRFLDALAERGAGHALKPLLDRAQLGLGGHREAIVRVRVGQGRFREALLAEHGPVCAITGPAPTEALEAGHLYGYAAIGHHFEGGGLLFRRDVHRLFDLGLLAIQPVDLVVDVSPILASYSVYADLQGRQVSVSVSERELGWLRLHWDEHRGRSVEQATA